MNRRWIGIDITFQSISLILKRLADKYEDEWPAIEANLKLDGVPRDMESAAANGQYEHPSFQRTDDRIQIVTVEEILEGRRLSLPMLRTDAVKAAAAVGDADKQAKLL